MTILTVGHSTRSIEEFIDLLCAHDVEHLADVRRYPASTRYPHFCMLPLGEALHGADIGYSHWPKLGGRLRPTGIPDNAGLRNPQFRGYADYMQSSDFAEQLRLLISLARAQRTAIMCSEAVFWRCHRSLLADALMCAGQEVLHIMNMGAPAAGSYSPSARTYVPPAGVPRIIYPAEAAQAALL